MGPKMGKRRGVHETTPELRNRMVGMYEAGLGLREIAAAVNCSQRTVKRWLNRFDKEGTVETRERCGRKRATTSEQDEAIVRLATETSLTAAKTVLPALGLTCSVDTVRERLHKAGIHSWSPSRKYIQRIPLGNDANGNPIQQALWRPTGTQLGKKKSLKDRSKNEKSSTALKKKNPPRKVRSRDLYVEDGGPSNNNGKHANNHPQQEDEVEPEEYVYHPPDIPEPQPNEIQRSAQPLQPNQAEFSNTLSLAQAPQPMYEHTGMNIAQSWPLDLGSHHYPQNQSNSVAHDEPPPQQQLEELHTQQEQQRRMQDQGQQTGQPHHHNIDQTQLSVDHQIPHHVQTQMPSPQANRNIDMDCTNTCSSSSSQAADNSKSRDKFTSTGTQTVRLCKSQRLKKGGKAKGTLETSVEIRNRMIGMSEAGLSTLSIALAIDRSERTVKRWLERWHKEGNVQTKERKGRRRITTKEEDEAIIAMATQHPLTAAKHVAPALGLKCSVDTIRERLHKAGIHSWKLGKKQGEGNAVHTVHLWQPSGNRPNKPKLPGEKKKKLSSGRKKDQTTGSAQKRASKKKKSESASLKMAPAPTNIMPTEQPTIPFHNPDTRPSIMQSVHTISSVPGAPNLSQAPPPPPPPPAPGPPPLQPMPIMQHRPDCRLAPTIVPPVSGQGNSGVVYPSCMVGSNSHAGHMDQPDPLNYEPYIWSF